MSSLLSSSEEPRAQTRLLLGQGIASIGIIKDAKPVVVDSVPCLQFRHAANVLVRVYGPTEPLVGKKVVANLNLFGWALDPVVSGEHITEALFEYEYDPTVSLTPNRWPKLHTDARECKTLEGLTHWFVGRGVIVWR